MLGNRTSASVTDSQPHNLWRRAIKQRSLAEVIIFRHDDQARAGCISPDSGVCSAQQTHPSGMLAAWDNIGQQMNQPVTQIFVKQKSHAAEAANLRSRAAAKARTAKTSS